ncbi:MAG: methionyl-tRNA formyltransferase [Ramlibacter sp.]
MRLVFAGTPDFARTSLEALHGAGFEIALVLTQPDRPAGRGMRLQASPVKQLAQEHGVPVSQPRSLRLDGKHPDDAAAAQAAILHARADAMVVAAYGLILPQWTLGQPRLGCLNIHASLLPRWRGAAPIHRAIEAGDAETGVSIMQMDAGLDTGDVLAIEPVLIDARDTTASLHDKLATLGGRMIVDTLRQAQRGALRPVPQPGDGITYAHKIGKSEAALHWDQPAVVLERKIRAFDPFPGATGTIGGEALKLWRAQTIADGRAAAATPGRVMGVDASGIAVACGEGLLRLTQLQRAGGKRLAAAEFLRGCSIVPGMTFTAA